MIAAIQPLSSMLRHGHFTATRGGGFDGLGEGHDAGGDERGVFAEGVAHRVVGLEAVLGQLVASLIFSCPWLPCTAQFRRIQAMLASIQRTWEEVPVSR